jgi:hypothetical protein
VYSMQRNVEFGYRHNVCSTTKANPWKTLKDLVPETLEGEERASGGVGVVNDVAF